MKNKEKIVEFIKKQRVSFIASVDEEGYPNMKAMNMPRRIAGNQFYFSTNTSSVRVSQYTKNNKASIYFFNKGRFTYTGVMLVGTMEVLTDPLSKESIWESGDTMYYKLGVTDPDYCVLRFTAEKGRYYSNFSSNWFEI